jgi:integrase
MSEGHIRRRGAKSWEIRFDVGRDPVTGKRRTQTKTVRGTKKEAQAELRRQLNALDEGTFVEPAKLTVAEYLDWWLTNEAAFNVTTRTLQGYREKVDKHVVPEIGAVRLQKLQPIHLQEMYTRKLQSGRRDGRGGLAPRSVVQLDRILNVALKRARQLRLIANNPVDDVRRPQIPKHEVDVLTDAEVKALLAHLDGTRLYVPVYLALSTGLRRGELLGLQWRDIDFDAKRLHVRRSVEQTRPQEADSGARYVLTLKEPKTKASKRTVSLPDSALEVLAAHQRAQKEERLKLGLGRPEPESLLFTKLDGSMLVPDHVGAQFKVAAGKAGLGKRGLHTLRHTHITNLLRVGVHVKVASERAGHSSVSVTLDIYSHVVPDMQDDAAQKVDAGLRRALDT